MFRADGTELLDLGGPPLLLEPVRAEIFYQGWVDIVSVRPLDGRGVPRDVEVERDGDRFTIDGRYAAYAYEIRTNAATPTPESLETPDPTRTALPTAPTETPNSPGPTSPLFLPAAELGR